MSKFIEDSISFGIGLFSYSKEKVEKAVEKMVEKGSIAREDASDFSKELISRGEEQREEIKKIVDERIQKAQDKFNNSIKHLTADEVRAIVREELEAYSKKQD